MKYGKTAKEVFEAWGGDYHADGMESEHWPRVRQMFDLIEASDGNYLEVDVCNGVVSENSIALWRHDLPNGPLPKYPSPSL